MALDGNKNTMCGACAFVGQTNVKARFGQKRKALEAVTWPVDVDEVVLVRHLLTKFKVQPQRKTVVAFEGITDAKQRLPG